MRSFAFFLPRAATRRPMLPALALVAALSLPSAAVHAQMSAPDIPFMAFYDHASTMKVPETFFGTPEGSPAPAAGPEALAFRWSPEVGADIRRELAAMYGGSDAARVRDIALSLDRADIAGEFRRLISSYGYDPDNLAHVSAAYLILQWETYSGQTAGAADAAGVAAQMDATLRRAPGLSDMGDAEKQRVADTLAHQAILGVANRRLLEQKGDRQGLDTLRAAILRDAQSIGWDFARLRLGPGGFVARDP
jgi:hypothetical protein